MQSLRSLATPALRRIVFPPQLRASRLSWQQSRLITGTASEPAAKEPAKESAKEPSKEPSKEPAKEPAKKQTRKVAKKPAKKPAKEPAKAPAEKHAKKKPILIPDAVRLLEYSSDDVSPIGRAFKAAWSHDQLFLQNKRARTQYFSPTDIMDFCRCSICRDPSSGQRNYCITELPLDAKFENVSEAPDGLLITMDKEAPRSGEGHGHQTVLSWDTIRRPLRLKNPTQQDERPSKLIAQRMTGVTYWDRNVLAGETRKIDYDEFMESDTGKWDVLQDLVRLGIAFVKNVPRDPESVVHLTTRIANIRETFYGRTFDVRAKPDAENVAYTSGSLGLHQDLLYLDPPPQIQVLHCMDNSCEGGESLFSDAERVGRMLWQLRDDPNAEVLRPLFSKSVPYGYKKGAHTYWKSRHTLEKAPGERHDDKEFFGNVFWSPPFMANLPSRPTQRTHDLIRAARVLESLVNHETAMYTYKMEPGECVLFDNLRVLHGRNAFDATSGGSRWLRGAYIAPDDFYSAVFPMPPSRRLPEDKRWSPIDADRDLIRSQWYREMWPKIREASSIKDEENLKLSDLSDD